MKKIQMTYVLVQHMLVLVERRLEHGKLVLVVHKLELELVRRLRNGQQID